MHASREEMQMRHAAAGECTNVDVLAVLLLVPDVGP